MESVTLAAVALVLVSKATEKVGEKLGEGAIAATKRLLAVLKREAPGTAARMEGAAEADSEMVQAVARAAEENAAVQAAVAETAAAIEQEKGSFESLMQLADKIGTIGTVNLAAVETQNINQTITQNF